VSSHQFAYAKQRRSTRIELSVPLIVQGVGAMREPYQEQVSTVSISCHGCSYHSKHEVIQGETVFLDVKLPTQGSVAYSTKARVKWAQKLGTKERVFQIAVELEVAGNIWGVAAPPQDWFPAKALEAIDPAAAGRELKLVTRKDQPAVTASEGGSALVERKEIAVAPPSPLAQLMLGLGEQIQTMAAEAAATAIVKERNRLLEDFRTHLREEAVTAIQSTISASKEVIARQVLKELSEAHESSARNSYAVWRKKIEQDMETVRQHMLTQAKEMSQQMEGMAGTTIERVQRNMETTRSEAVDRFVSRLRDQVGPMLIETRDSLQKLLASEAAFKKESDAIYAGLEDQLEYTANASLAKAQEELERNSTAIAGKTNETLVKLYQNLEKAAQKNVESLLASMGGQLTRILQEKAAEVSREFTTGLEGYTRSYLESIGKSIAEIPQNIPARSHT